MHTSTYLYSAYTITICCSAALFTWWRLHLSLQKNIFTAISQSLPLFSSDILHSTWQFFTRKWRNTKWLDLKLYGILLGCYGLLWEGRRLDQTTVFRSQVKNHGHWSMVMLSFVVLVLVSLYSEALSVTWQNKSKLNSWKYKGAKS